MIACANRQLISAQACYGPACILTQAVDAVPPTWRHTASLQSSGARSSVSLEDAKKAVAQAKQAAAKKGHEALERANHSWAARLATLQADHAALEHQVGSLQLAACVAGNAASQPFVWSHSILHVDHAY